MRRNTGWQIRKIISEKLKDEEDGEDKGKDGKSKSKWSGYRNEYNDQILLAYDECLKKNQNLTGE